MSQQDNPYRAPDAAIVPAKTEVSIETLIMRGRLIFFAIVALFFLFDIVVTLILGAEPNPTRIVATGCLLFVAWLGYGWARVVLGLLVGIAVPLIAISVIGTFRVGYHLLATVQLMFLGSYILIFIALFYSKSLKAYLKRKISIDATGTTSTEPDTLSLPENPTGKELFTVATFDHRAMADVCRIAIEQEGIDVFIADDHLVGGANFFLSNAVRGIKVQVSDIDAKRAVEIWHRTAPAAETNGPDHDTPVEFDCEECGKTISFPGNRRGRVETCPQCGQYVDVPE